MEAVLIREMLGEKCTVGKLKIGDYELDTLELPWRDNKRNKSCIPTGEYICRRIVSPKFGETFEICGVPNRSLILFHSGNVVSHTCGCVLVGIGYNDGRLYNSKRGMLQFAKATAGVDEFQLVILQ